MPECRHINEWLCHPQTASGIRYILHIMVYNTAKAFAPAVNRSDPPPIRRSVVFIKKKQCQIINKIAAGVHLHALVSWLVFSRKTYQTSMPCSGNDEALRTSRSGVRVPSGARFKTALMRGYTASGNFGICVFCIQKDHRSNRWFSL